MALALVIASLLLAMGVVIRQSIPALGVARIPASLIAGLLGLGAIQNLTAADVRGPVVTEVIEHWQGWPSTLIAVVFAGMLLARKPSRPTDGLVRRRGFAGVRQEGLMVWIIVLGQSMVGCAVLGLFLQPWYDLPNSAGFLIETGLAGGHGTAAAMGSVLKHPSIDFPEGLDLGILMATMGLLYGLAGGMVWVHFGLARGWMRSGVPQPTRAAGNALVDDSRGPEQSRSPIAPDAIDPLLMQLVWLMIAFGIGLGIQTCVGGLGVRLDGWTGDPSLGDRVSAVSEDPSMAAISQRTGWSGILGSFPLFIYTLFGGAIVSGCLKSAGCRDWIEPSTMDRWIGLAMDLLVVAAVATLNLQTVSALWLPLTVLFVAGAAWSTFCLLVLSRRILPADIWFPLGLINFGMSTGVTATGFVLLRVVDPELKSGAAEDYALAAPLSAPFVGGGMLTIGLPLLVLERIPIGVTSLVLALIVGGLIWLGIRFNRPL